MEQDNISTSAGDESITTRSPTLEDPQQDTLRVLQADGLVDDSSHNTVQDAVVKSTSVSTVDQCKNGGPIIGAQESTLSAESAKFEAQMLETKALLDTVERFANDLVSHRLKPSMPKKPSETDLAAMPHLLGDVEKIFDRVNFPTGWHEPPGQSVGYYTDLAIMSLTRHLERLKKEKDQLVAMETEVRRLRSIETRYNLRRTAVGALNVMPKAQGTVIHTEPNTAADPTTTAVQNQMTGNNKSSDGPLLSSAVPNAAPDEDVRCVPQLNRLEWTAFREVITLDHRPFAIDVLDGEPAISFQDEQQFWWLPGSSTGPGRETKQRTVPTPQKQSMLPGQAPLPERIRINSKAITEFLNSVFWKDPGWKRPTGEDDEFPGWVMIRPYKALICFEKEIRLRYSENFDHDNATDSSDKIGAVQPRGIAVEDEDHPTSGEQSPHTMIANDSAKDDRSTFAAEPAVDQVQKSESTCSISSLDSWSDHEHMDVKCLMEFMNELKQKTSWIESPQCQNITFDDLWFMFKPGDEVVDQGRNQVYRIMEVTGAVHKVTPPWRAFEDFDGPGAQSQKAYIKLRCAYIDFDGEQLGPTSVSFTIRRWDGSKAVTSLGVFPLHCLARRSQESTKADFESRVQAIRNRFIERGRTYVDVTANAFKHMHYSGLTLDGDEVDSHVVVDFNEAFLSSVVRRSKLENLITLGQSLGTATIDQKSLCKADCCKNEAVCEEEFAELKRSREDFAGLIPEDTRREPSLAIYPRESRPLRSAIGTIPDSDLVIMSYTAPGFILRNRKWGEFFFPKLSGFIFMY